MNSPEKGKMENLQGKITVAIAVCSLLLNGVQYWVSRHDAQRERDATAREKAQQQEIEAWKSMPSISFQHWQFQGDTRKVCNYFSPEMMIRPEAMGWRTGNSKTHPGSIKVLQTPTSDRVLKKLHLVCSSKSAADNDAKDWRFVLAINDGDTDVDLKSIDYSNAASDSKLDVELRPADGLLIPVGFVQAGRPMADSDYVWPSKLSYTWVASLGRPLSQTVAVRQSDVGAIGYVLDAGGGSPVLSAPPQ
jgi:hypothetical protein